MNMLSKLNPDGLKQSPIKSVEIPLQQPIKVDDKEFPMNSSVGWIDLLKLWVKENLITESLNLQKGVVMGNSKAWYTSKTVIFNILMAAWVFIGPLIGIPTLSTELFESIIVVGNLILRLVTKGAVTIA